MQRSGEATREAVAQQAQEAAARAQAAAQDAAARIAEQIAQGVGRQGGAVPAQQRLREELRDQLNNLMQQREDVSDQLQDPMVSGSNRTGLTQRLERIDGRIGALDKQLEELDASIARAGGGQGLLIRQQGPPVRRSPDPPEAYIALTALFILCAILPLSIAFARRIWRRSSAAVAALPKEIADRLSHMDQNLDAIALEVERIGESQRYLTRMQTQQIGGGAAEAVEAPDRAKDWQRRSP